MNCCNTVVCLNVCVGGCGPTVDLPGIVADVAGDWKVIVEFAGARFTYDQFFDVGDQIVIRSDSLNENFSHLIQLYRRTDPLDASTFSLFNNTCYSLKTSIEIKMSDPTSQTLNEKIELKVNYTDVRLSVVDGKTVLNSPKLVSAKTLIIVVEKNTLFPGIGADEYQVGPAANEITFGQELSAGQSVQVFIFK